MKQYFKNILETHKTLFLSIFIVFFKNICYYLLQKGCHDHMRVLIVRVGCSSRNAVMIFNAFIF